MDAFNERAVARAQESVRRPLPVAGISHAAEDRLWTYDPTITIAQDIRDAAGHLIAARGQKFNPLDHLSFKHDYLFIDGDSKAEVAWALKHGDQQQCAGLEDPADFRQGLLRIPEVLQYMPQHNRIETRRREPLFAQLANPQLEASMPSK